MCDFTLVSGEQEGACSLLEGLDKPAPDECKWEWAL